MRTERWGRGGQWATGPTRPGGWPCRQWATLGVVTHILSAIEQGDPSVAEQLLPLVYDELRKLAAERLSHEKPGQTLQATALVHEAYLRLVSPDQPQAPEWNSRGHFFAAAAEAMRRILVENARRKGRLKRGGDRQRTPTNGLAIADPEAELAPLAPD